MAHLKLYKKKRVLIDEVNPFLRMNLKEPVIFDKYIYKIKYSIKLLSGKSTWVHSTNFN